MRRACDALTDQADARILSVLMDLAPKAPSDEALPASVARAASMLVQTLPIEIQGEKMDDSSDSDDDARRGTLVTRRRFVLMPSRRGTEGPPEGL